MNARLWAAAVVFGLAGSAMGQYALDRSLQVGSGGVNAPGRDFKKEMEFRNAIVTGNAPGGISFRGDVGYRAPGEFFGHLGSNETFSYRRDSVYSGLGGVGLRGTDALQYQFAVTTGNAPPAGLTGIPLYGRSGATSTASDRVGMRTEGLKDISKPTIGEYGYDSRGLSLMSVRSPSAYMANRGLQPALLGRGDSGTESKAVTASMLRGVAYDDIGILGVRKPAEAKPPPPTAAPSSALNTAAPSTEDKSAAPPTDVRSAYDDLVDRIKKGTSEAGKGEGVEKPADAKQGDTPEWQKRLDELRDQLRDKSGASKKPAKPDDKNKPEGAPGATPEKGGDKGADKPSGPDTDTVGIIKRAGDRISALAPPSFDAYGSQMKTGQECLATGRFFDAEERFTAALSAKPRDPMAMVGRIHAQLGAGMFLSASINLRQLLTDHPELAGMKYSDQLLPVGQRKGVVLERLGELVGDVDGRGRDSGLLMAYVGYQVGDKAAIKRGLDAMSAGGPAEADQLARLADLLRRVWTDGDAPALNPPAKAEPKK